MVNSIFETKIIQTDVCVVGGGLSGVAAAVSAARHGAKVTLVQDRAMLGGNASSEIRMWVCGAHGDNMRETGIIEELMLNNYYRNPYKNYHIWDTVMLEIVQNEPNITLLLNCSCLGGKTENDTIKNIQCWQTTTQKFYEIAADIFIDCSGDSILAPISNALFMQGREARNEYNESIAPEKADKKTMGLSLLIQAREYPYEREFIAPKWAKKFTKEDLPFRMPDLESDFENFWYIELGGVMNTIDDTEIIRDELLKAVYGIWDFIKNDPSQKEKNKNYDLDFVGILPGKRESRRYIGDLVMTENDVLAEGKFHDIIAYGGWTMDDHNPEGLYGKQAPNIFHPAPSPYGIPYRCLYSKNVKNLMFAGRNISVTHAAMSSTRVMATCALLGQAAGTAAAIAKAKNIMPRGVLEHISELQNTLMTDDCYLPFTQPFTSDKTKKATLVSNFENAENLRNGIDRKVGDNINCAVAQIGGFARYEFENEEYVDFIKLVFDSDLNRETLSEREYKLNRGMVNNIRLGFPKSYIPKTLVCDFEIKMVLGSGEIKTISVTDNHQRLVKIAVADTVKSIEFVSGKTYGTDTANIFSFMVF